MLTSTRDNYDYVGLAITADLPPSVSSLRECPLLFLR